MNIIKYYKHQGKITDLSQQHNSFSRLIDAEILFNKNRQWRNTVDGTLTNQILVAFFGKTGYGKSSTVNAFFGRSIMETSDVSSCTTVCNSLDYQLSNSNYLSFGDFPGIGELEYKDREYLTMYKNFMAHTTAIVYVIRADTRDYSIDESAYNFLFPTNLEREKVILAINCCDKIEPINRSAQKTPTAAQLENIKSKLQKINDIFSPANNAIPYSAATGWNINILSEAITERVILSGDVLIKNSF